MYHLMLLWMLGILWCCCCCWHWSSCCQKHGWTINTIIWAIHFYRFFSFFGLCLRRLTLVQRHFLLDSIIFLPKSANLREGPLLKLASWNLSLSLCDFDFLFFLPLGLGVGPVISGWSVLEVDTSAIGKGVTNGVEVLDDCVDSPWGITIIWNGQHLF